MNINLARQKSNRLSFEEGEQAGQLKFIAKLCPRQASKRPGARHGR